MWGHAGYTEFFGEFALCALFEGFTGVQMSGGGGVQPAGEGVFGIATFLQKDLNAALMQAGDEDVAGSM